MTQETTGNDSEAAKPRTPFGERLKASRDAAGMSIQAIAEALNVTKQAIYNYEKVPRDISADTLFKLADLLGVNARWLLYGIGDGDEPVAPVPAHAHPAINQSIACLEAFLSTGGQARDLIRASIAILNNAKA